MAPAIRDNMLKVVFLVTDNSNSFYIDKKLNRKLRSTEKHLLPLQDIRKKPKKALFPEDRSGNTGDAEGEGIKFNKQYYVFPLRSYRFLRVNICSSQNALPHKIAVIKKPPWSPYTKEAKTSENTMH